MRLICSECGISCFNPGTRRGCDPVAIDIVLDPVPGFNPRTRRGCDEVIFNRDILINEFQSTHPQGVRQFFLYPSIYDTCNVVFREPVIFAVYIMRKLCRFQFKIHFPLLAKAPPITQQLKVRAIIP